MTDKSTLIIPGKQFKVELRGKHGDKFEVAGVNESRFGFRFTDAKGVTTTAYANRQQMATIHDMLTSWLSQEAPAQLGFRTPKRR
jgi:hypothetical protein